MSYKKEPNTRSYKRRYPKGAVSPSQYGLMQAARGGKGYARGISDLVTEEMIHRTPKKKRSLFAKELARARRNNPDSEGEMVESFHGRKPEGEVEVTEVEKFNSRLAVIGDLVELVVKGHKEVVRIFFPKDRPRLCCDGQGKNLEIVGGDQSLEVEPDKNLVPIGFCHKIVYETDKHHLDDSNGEVAQYEHEFSEESRGPQPMLVYDARNRKMFLVGGSYEVKAEGIKD
jgi:hypothetical protein